MDYILNLTIDMFSGKKPLIFNVKEVINGGYSSRNQRDLLAHIEELKELNLPNPKTVPTMFPVSNYLVSTKTEVQVQHEKTNGEIEFILLLENDEWYITVASDHTDRKLESFSVPISKQSYPNFIASTVWRVKDVLNHWDRIELKSWVTINGNRQLYQKGSLAEILPFSYWENYMKEINLHHSGSAIMSGTLPLLDGIKYGETFEYEMTDPVLERKVSSFYQLKYLMPPIE